MAAATPKRDLFTARDAVLSSQFQWKRLSDSLLVDQRGVEQWDVVTGFQSQSHRLKAPSSVISTRIPGITGQIAQLTPAQIASRGVGGMSFKANSAAAFTCKGYRGTFVVFNDGRDGYQALSDSVIFLAGHQFNGAAISIV